MKQNEQLWIDRTFKSRNLEGPGYDGSKPLMYPHAGRFFCHSPPDGKITESVGDTPQQAYDQWLKRTIALEQIQDECLKAFGWK